MWVLGGSSSGSGGGVVGCGVGWCRCMIVVRRAKHYKPLLGSLDTMYTLNHNKKHLKPSSLHGIITVRAGTGRALLSVCLF